MRQKLPSESFTLHFTRGFARAGTRTPVSKAIFAAALATAFAAVLAMAPRAHAQTPKKEYLSEQEANQIRDAYLPNEKIKLFIGFAADRLKKLQYVQEHKDETPRRVDLVNTLINGYAGCVDDAADLIDIGVDKSQDIREGIKLMQSKAPEFLMYLQTMEDSKDPALDDYKDNLDDAIDATKGAIAEAGDADKELAPPPQRRKPN